MKRSPYINSFNDTTEYNQYIAGNDVGYPNIAVELDTGTIINVSQAPVQQGQYFFVTPQDDPEGEHPIVATYNESGIPELICEVQVGYGDPNGEYVIMEDLETYASVWSSDNDDDYIEFYVYDEWEEEYDDGEGNIFTAPRPAGLYFYASGNMSGQVMIEYYNTDTMEEPIFTTIQVMLSYDPGEPEPEDPGDEEPEEEGGDEGE